MKDELGIALIGCGHIGVTHLEAIKSVMEKEGGVRLIATADPVGDLAEKWGRQYGAESFHKDHREVLANPEVDAVVLALPNFLHAPITVEAAQANKHILVEKPMANSTDEADSMVAAAEKADVTLMVAQSRRYIKALFNAWEMIDEIGTPISATYLSLLQQEIPLSWMKTKANNGHLVYSTTGAHTIDYMLWLLKGKKPVRVYSEGYSNIPDIEGVDEASVVIGFDDGTMATTVLSRNNRTPRIERIVVIGTQGAMHMEHGYRPSKGAAQVGEAYSKLIVNEKTVWEGIQEEWPFTIQMKEFLSSVRDGRPPIAVGREVRNVIPIIEAADLSAQQHELIHL